MRVLLGAVFLYAGLVKLRTPQDFADAVATFRLLPGAAINVFAMTLPVFEALLGAWLLSGWRLRSASFCAAATVLAFLGALASALVRGLHVECGCFGGTVELAHNPWIAMARDTGLFGVAVVLYVASCRKTSR